MKFLKKRCYVISSSFFQHEAKNILSKANYDIQLRVAAIRKRPMLFVLSEGNYAGVRTVAQESCLLSKHT